MKKQTTLLFLCCIALFTSCKKASEWANKLEDSYWKNVENSILHFGNGEAYLEDAGSSPLGTNTSVFDYTSTPLIRNLVQTGENQWTGEIVRGTYSGNTLTAISYQNTNITLTSSNGTEKLSFSNADPSMINWDRYTSSGGSTTPIPTNKDTTSVVFTDTTNSYTYRIPNQNHTETYARFAVRSGWRKLGSIDGFYWRIYAIVRPGFQDDAILAFREKPTVSGVYRLDSGCDASLISVYPGTIGLRFRSECSRGNTNATVNVTVNGDKIIVEGTNIPLGYTGTSGGPSVTFRVVAK